MKITIEVPCRPAELRAYLRTALYGLFATTNEACEVREELEELVRSHTTITADAIILNAYAKHHTIAATARAVGLARSTVRERLSKMSARAHALDAVGIAPRRTTTRA